MPSDPRFDILFEPVQIGPKTLRNRFYQVPHCTGFGVEKPWSQAAHRAVKAEGGWAAVCTEYCTVSADADETPYISARMWDDHDLRHLALTCEAAHAHGALAGIELSHSGAHGENGETRLPPPAPSQIPSDFSGITPKAMEQVDIDRIISDWVAAAVRSRDAGFDIVYVYGGHSYLLGQMLSPFYNQRTDAYGGSLENRARMWIETLAAVREAVGSDCAIACRMAVSQGGGASVSVEEGLEFVRMADDLVDLWDVHLGSILEWSLDSGASRFFAEGWQLEWTGRMREATQKPIVGVGRLTTPDRMVEIIESGVWDLIGAARPNIADPFIPEKIRTGRIGDIRACIGCNMCISKGDVRRHIGCTQNATAGEEHRRGWHPERFDRAGNADREVLVVGAGPAGMECAIVLGRRGMRRVRLVDAAARAGRHHPLDPAPARPAGVGPAARRGGWVSSRSSQNVADRDGRAPGRRGRARRGRRPGRGRDRRRMGARRPKRRHPRADPRCRRLAGTRADARAGDARGQAAAGLAGGRARLRRLLHGRGHGRAAAAATATRWSS